MSGENARRELPSGWQWVKLGEICDFIRGISFEMTDVSYNSDDGYYPILRAGNIELELDTLNDLIWIPSKYVSQEKILREGDIVICMSSGSPSVVGKTARVQVPWRGSVGAFCGIVRTRDPLLSLFLHYWFRSRLYLDWRDSQARGVNIQNLRFSQLEKLELPLPPLAEQQRTAAILQEQMAAVDKARAAADRRLEAVKALPASYVRATLLTGRKRKYLLREILTEIKSGIGGEWPKYPVFGATREGVAPAKENVGKIPERYKLVDPVTVFYNPMRIQLGSIAMVDEGEPPGITSPDYVVVKGRSGILDTRWFYYWFRSSHGAKLIDELSRGAVRERILFNRLALGVIELPDYSAQLLSSAKMEQIKPLVKIITKELETINTLPVALLRRAFNGEL